jgi:hypothetical protein
LFYPVKRFQEKKKWNRHARAYLFLIASLKLSHLKTRQLKRGSTVFLSHLSCLLIYQDLLSFPKATREKIAELLLNTQLR